MRNYLYVIIAVAIFSQSANANNKISVCTDDDNWFPYVYMKGDNTNEVEGIVISMTQKIFNKLGFQADYHAYPWLRCLELLKEGAVDVVIAGTYTEERAEYAHFPIDAKKLVDSQYVLSRDPFIVMTSKNENFVYKGNDNDIPAPIRSIHGYNITEEFLGLKLPVKEHYSSKSGIDELLRTKRGSLIINRMSADRFLNEPKYGKHLQYNSTPVRVSPYFIMFSKSTDNLTEEQRAIFYNYIKSWRERSGVNYIY